MSDSSPEMMDIHPEVQEALASHQPVVALESTIISHGMPYPQNLETARRVEAVIRSNGAIPATIAMIHGRLKAGLNEADLLYLASSGEAVKASSRDLPALMVKGASAATTVAATMVIARMAGISVFATGGIGGVHRGAEKSFDISADLTELSRTPVAVVSAGAKAILDLPLTLEYLETMGVPVIGFGTDSLPAFYTRESGLAVPIRLDTAQEVARSLHSQWAMGLPAGALIANPIPEAWSMAPEIIDQAIELALSELEAKAIQGKEVTPYLLARIKDLTAGQSLVSNIELVCHNAALAAQISKELGQIPQGN